MRLTLRRFGSTPYGSFGELRCGQETFYTVERAWRSNKKGQSCIPFGSYSMHWQDTTTQVPSVYGGQTWYLEGDGVGEGKHRTRIAVHVANTCEDVRGCIGVGMALGTVNGSWAVTRSNDAFMRLYDLLGPEDHEMSILGSLMG